jgi:hypothetical protein
MDQSEPKRGIVAVQGHQTGHIERVVIWARTRCRQGSVSPRTGASAARVGDDVPIEHALCGGRVG